MSFSFPFSYLIRSQENHRAPDAKLNGEQNRHANLYDTALKVLNNIQYFSQYTCLYYDALKWISILPLLHPSSSTAHYNGLKHSLCVSINLKRLLFAIKRHQNVLDTVLYTVHQLLWDLQLQRLRVCKTTKLCPLATTGDKTEQRYFMT